MSLVFVLADTPLLENRIYLHLSIFRESLLFESQFVTTFHTWLTIVMSADGDGPESKKTTVICIQSSIKLIRELGKVIYID